MSCELPQDGATHHQHLLPKVQIISGAELSSKTLTLWPVKIQQHVFIYHTMTEKITNVQHSQSSSFGREMHDTPGSHWTDSERRMQRPYPEFCLLCSMIFWNEGDRKNNSVHYLQNICKMHLGRQNSAETIQLECFMVIFFNRIKRQNAKCLSCRPAPLIKPCIEK